ncbi:hypothetical protein GINT2_001601 [Glugoides intestinalis]
MDVSNDLAPPIMSSSSDSTNIFYYIVKWLLLLLYYILKVILFSFVYIILEVFQLTYKTILFCFESIYSAHVGLFSAIFIVLFDIALTIKLSIFSVFIYMYKSLELMFNIYKTRAQVRLMFLFHPLLTVLSVIIIFFSLLFLIIAPFKVIEDRRRRIYTLISLASPLLCLSSLIFILVSSEGILLYSAILFKAVFIELILIPVTVLYYKNVHFKDMPKFAFDLASNIYNKLRTSKLFRKWKKKTDQREETVAAQE